MGQQHTLTRLAGHAAGEFHLGLGHQLGPHPRLEIEDTVALARTAEIGFASHGGHLGGCTRFGAEIGQALADIF